MTLKAATQIRNAYCAMLGALMALSDDDNTQLEHLIGKADARFKDLEEWVEEVRKSET